MQFAQLVLKKGGENKVNMSQLNNRPLMYFCGNCLALAIVKGMVRPFKDVFPPDGKTNVPISISAQCPICGTVSRGIDDEFIYHPDLERLVTDSASIVQDNIEKQRRVSDDTFDQGNKG